MGEGKIPLEEALRRVPKDARLEVSRRMYAGLIPVGRYCHEAAEVIDADAAQIAGLKAEIAKLEGRKETQTFHPISHRSAICSECGKPVGEHVIIRQRGGMEIICPKEEE